MCNVVKEKKENKGKRWTVFLSKGDLSFNKRAIVVTEEQKKTAIDREKRNGWTVESEKKGIW